MLKNISIENFFSFGESQTITLDAGANLLVGINGSGKSNFFRAIRLLQAVLVMIAVGFIVDIYAPSKCGDVIGKESVAINPVGEFSPTISDACSP